MKIDGRTLSHESSDTIRQMAVKRVLLRRVLSAGPSGAVFGCQIFVPRQQLLVHRSRDVSQDPRAIHNGSLPRSSAIASLIATKIKPTASDTRKIDYRLGSSTFLTLRVAGVMPTV
jgi:hypothetical protein